MNFSPFLTSYSLFVNLTFYHPDRNKGKELDSVLIAKGLGRESRAAKYDSPTDVCGLRLKFMLLGDTAAGKSCLTNQFLTGRFDPTHKPTIAVEFHQSCVLVGRTQLWLNIWNLSGGDNKNIPDVGSTHFRGLDGVLIVCDVTKPSLLERIAYWLKVVDENTAKDYKTPVPVLIMVNKIDCLGERPEISLDHSQLDKFCNGGRALGWFATSAKTGMNVEACVNELTRIVLSNPGPCISPLAKAIPEKDLKSLSVEIERLHTSLSARNPPSSIENSMQRVNKFETATLKESEPNKGHHAERGHGCRCIIS